MSVKSKRKLLQIVYQMWDIVPHWYTKVGEKSERISQLEKREENVRENVKIY